jgi:endonuclease YncB( thermonuclease family)
LRNQFFAGVGALLLQLFALHAAAEGSFFKNRPGAAATPPTAPSTSGPVEPARQPQPAPQAAPAPVNVSGNVDRVVTTDTFLVGGVQIQLVGVEGAPSPYTEMLAQWLTANGNQMTCEPEGMRYRCTTPGGVDVGGVVIFNGAGKASPDAPQEYQEAQAQAQAGMKGVWQ